MIDAVEVIGQPSFAAAGAGVSNKKMTGPNGLATDGVRLLVSEYQNRRVLIFPEFPPIGASAAGVVLGQKNFRENKSLVSRSGYAGPGKILVVHNRLWVADFSNHRVLGYHQIPEENNAAADVVLGQVDFSKSHLGATETQMNHPVDIASDGKVFFVSDYGNHRVLGYKKIPELSGAPADFILGQENFYTNQPGKGINGFHIPQGIYCDGNRLFIADSGNNRVLIYNHIPTSSSARPDLVLGQPDFEQVGAGVSSREFHEPDSILVNDGVLFVSDLKNNRVLIWKNIPEQSGMQADSVLGQKDFISAGKGAGRAGFFMPRAMLVHNKKLYVADRGNHRILVFLLSDILNSSGE